MKTSRIDIGSIRREQIVEAAVAVIAEQGIQNLSLSEIEKKAEMSRGQLTYYFPAKEDILLAVFDRLLELMYQRLGTPRGDGPECAADASVWEWVRHLMHKLLVQGPVSPEFSCLQYTFLSQSNHREDFRGRLARLYEEWRGNMAQGFAAELADKPANRPASPRLLASVVQALLHGLLVQLAADPNAFDRQEMFNLCLDMLVTYLQVPARPRSRRRVPAKKTPVNGSRNGSRRAGPAKG